MNSNLAFHFDYTDYAVKMGTEGDIFQTILDDYAKLGLVGEETNKLMAYLAATLRLMEKPLNILVLSSSGAGKSALQDKTLKLMPPESVIRVSAITEQSALLSKIAQEQASGVGRGRRSQRLIRNQNVDFRGLSGARNGIRQSRTVIARRRRVQYLPNYDESRDKP